MQYSFTCPLEGCHEKMITDAGNKEEAVEKLSRQAKQHLEEKHPEIKKTEEEITNDIRNKVEMEG